MSNKFVFASSRGRDFIVHGDIPEDAFETLLPQLKENGELYKVQDIAHNKHAVEKMGFTKMGTTYASPVYKCISYGNELVEV